MKIKVVNVRKFFRGILIVLALMIIASFFISNVTLSHGDVKYKSIYVSNGDTLWSIAKLEQEDNKYYEGKDIRDIIDDIKSANNLSNSNLNPQQKLNIPTI